MGGMGWSWPAMGTTDAARINPATMKCLPNIRLLGRMQFCARGSSTNKEIYGRWKEVRFSKREKKQFLALAVTESAPAEFPRQDPAAIQQPQARAPRR